MTDADIIKLAEAMGWEPTSSYTNVAGEVEVTRWRTPDGTMGQRLEDLPDPFTDANHDYAVLEHFRALSETGKDDGWELWERFRSALADEIWYSAYKESRPMTAQLTAASGYRVGNNARAALKVIDDKG